MTYEKGGKRLLDMAIVLAASPLIAFTCLVVVVVVWFGLGCPVLHVQQRPGRRSVSFRMFKFRTMSDDRDEVGRLLPDEQRLGRIGRFLRSTSLDEVPEVINVLKGEMSLVGPRPLLMEYLPLYSVEQARRHEVRPGITGWAQVNGRNALSWEEKFALDVWYVDNQSLALDLKILAITFWKVVRREGISAQGNATMPRLTGNQPARD